jgi:small lipoprotein (TIGR04454 family)
MRTVLFLVILVGCGGKKETGPTCDQVVDHMLEVTKQQLMGHESVNLGSQRKAMVAQCEQRNMSIEMRTCLVGTQTISDIAKCRGGKTDVLEKPRRPKPGTAPGSAAPTTAPGSAAGSAGSGH